MQQINKLLLTVRACNIGTKKKKPEAKAKRSKRQPESQQQKQQGLQAGNLPRKRKLICQQFETNFRPSNDDNDKGSRLRQMHDKSHI